MQTPAPSLIQQTPSPIAFDYTSIQQPRFANPAWAADDMSVQSVLGYEFIEMGDMLRTYTLQKEDDDDEAW